MNMQSDRAQTRYSAVAMWLHWIIAALIIANWQMVERTEHAAQAVKQQFFGFHMATGILILTLSLIRLGWRFTHKPPAPLTSYKPWERMLSGITHFLLYAIMIGVPLSGWIAKSTGKYFDKPVDMWGLFNIPSLPFGKVESLHEAGEAIHHLGITAFQILLFLHVAGALKHLFIDKDGTMRRMLPGKG